MQHRNPAILKPIPLYVATKSLKVLFCDVDAQGCASSSAPGVGSSDHKKEILIFLPPCYRLHGSAF